MIKDLYRDEMNEDVYLDHDQDETAVYSDNYVHWLEKKLEENQDKWISISDKTKKLPKGDFLVLFDNGDVRRYFEENHPFALYTHYQPLPTPPKQ